MTAIPQKELRNQVGEVLRRVEAGEVLTVTVAGRPVAQLSPAASRTWVSGADLARVFAGPVPQTLGEEIDDPCGRPPPLTCAAGRGAGQGAASDRMARLASVAAYGVVGAMVLVGVLLFAAAMTTRRLLAPSAPTGAKRATYECGVDPVGEHWAQTNVRYFVYAFLYVVFAVDAVYLFPWATVIRDSRLGLASLVEMGIFIAVLLIGLAHAARRGLLRWV